MNRMKTAAILSVLAAMNHLCCFTIEAAEYVCIRNCDVYVAGGNRAVATVAEGRKLQGQPDATGRWLIVSARGRQYSMDITCFETAEEIAAEQEEKSRALAKLDERIREIEQELRELKIQSSSGQGRDAGQPGPPNGGVGSPTQQTSRIVMVASNNNSLEKKILEKELRSLERKRDALATQ